MSVVDSEEEKEVHVEEDATYAKQGSCAGPGNAGAGKMNNITSADNDIRAVESADVADGEDPPAPPKNFEAEFGMTVVAGIEQPTVFRF